MVLVDFYSVIEERWIKVEVTEEVAAYLYKNNKANKSAVKKNVYQVLDEDVLDETPSCEKQEELARLQERRELQKQVLHIALRTITPWQRKIIMKRFYEDKLPGIIAEEFGITRIAVFKTLKAAYRSLHSFLASVRGAVELYDEYSDGKFGLKCDL